MKKGNGESGSGISSEPLQEKIQNKRKFTKYIDRYPKMDFMLTGPKDDQRTLCMSYLNIKQLDALNFIMSLFHASTCFGHKCSSSGGQNCTIQSLVSSHL